MNEPFQMHSYNLIFKVLPNQPRLNCLRLVGIKSARHQLIPLFLLAFVPDVKRFYFIWWKIFEWVYRQPFKILGLRRWHQPKII